MGQNRGGVHSTDRVKAKVLIPFARDQFVYFPILLMDEQNCLRTTEASDELGRQTAK